MPKQIVYDTKWLEKAVDARSGIPIDDDVWLKALSSRAIDSGELGQTSFDNQSENRSDQVTLIDYELQRAWKDFWDIHLSTLIREIATNRHAGEGTQNSTQEADSPGVDFWELCEDRYEYEPYPYGLIRAMRRVFSRFNLEAFVEDRTFPDYRNHLNQELDAVLVEAKDFYSRALKAITLLGALRNKVNLLVNNAGLAAKVAKQIDEMVDAIEKTKAQIAVVETLRDSGFTARIFEKLRVLHTNIQSQWGTWARRVKIPCLQFLKYFALALAMYVALGIGMPTEFWLLICGALPLLAFGESYYSSRGEQNEGIRETTAMLAIFHPEPAIETLHTVEGKSDLDDFKAQTGEPGIAARRYTLWFAKVPKSGSKILEQYRKHMDDLQNRSYERLMGKRAKPEREEIAFQPTDIEVTSDSWHKWLRGVVWGCLLLVAALWCYAPLTFAVESKVSDGTCVVAEGSILWAGPWEVIVHNSNGGFTIIPRDQVARIAAVHNTTQTPVDAQKERASRSVSPDSGIERTGTGISCATKSRSSAVAPAIVTTVINVSGSQAAHKGVLVIPFPQDENNKIPCKGNLTKHLGAKVPLALTGVLANVSNAMKACSAADGSPPRIDVRGFASSLDFDQSCGIASPERNAELAEARRSSVLLALNSKEAGRFEEKNEAWTSPFATLEPNGKKRWNSWQHMRDALVVRDKVGGNSVADREALSRHAEIWFLDLAGCDTFNALSGIR